MPAVPERGDDCSDVKSADDDAGGRSHQRAEQGSRQND